MYKPVTQALVGRLLLHRPLGHHNIKTILNILKLLQREFYTACTDSDQYLKYFVDEIVNTE